ncbi:cation-independent mannose-6-phosphate receptor [Hermetia illucens]|uniref:cation-independent mannose-6-phosphate receptor n=1 Tax=Hermetia illucens TaxID=343691 RepID=UPI0018CC73A1|nr:cation-independent mannose-6-phosphate receptor [Hermetia illucens]
MSWLDFRVVLIVVLLTLISDEPVQADEVSAGEIVVDGCQLKEPVYDYTFNLTALNSLGRTVHNERGDRIEFNVCGGLSRSCGDKTNVGACLTKNDGKAFTLGKTSKLHYKSGRLYFSFVDGEKCSGDKNYTLYLTLSCDYTMDVYPLDVIPTEDSECTFYINLRTIHACLPLPANLESNVCSATDDKTGHKFDLMPFSDSNYRVSDRGGSYFIINVCKPVLYGQDSMCPADSGVCYINNNATDIKQKFVNYGIASPAPVFENGQLYMNFSSNTKCNDKENISSVIYFLCYRDVELGNPEFISKNGCRYEFSWLTSLACNYVQPCTTLVPSTGKKYDFNPIAGVYNVTQGDKHYMVGICKDIGSPCLSGDGACELNNNQATSLGKSTVELNVNETGSPFAIYTSGSKCNSSQNWTTKIEFICSNNQTDQGPKIIENSNCVLIVHFKTSLACQEQILCKVVDAGRTIDLTPLISTNENYVATVNETALKAENSNSVKYYLNVCRPLVSQYGLSCPGGSAACKAIVKGSGTPEQEQSLGYPTSSLTLYNSKVQLKYIYGDKCPADESEKMSTRIDFKCALAAGRGNPILQSIVNKCHYQFDWLTSVICPPQQCNFFTDTCIATNVGTGKSFNFRNAKFTNNGIITVEAKPKSFDIDVCAQNQTVFADYSESVVKLFFVTTGSCNSGDLLNVQLRFVCGMKETNSTVHDNGACNIILTRQTPEVCDFLGLPVQNPVPTPTTTPTPTAAPTPSPTKPPITQTPSATTTNTPGTPGDGHPPESKSRMVTAAAVIITVTMIGFVIMSIVCLRDPGRRMAVKNFFRRNSPAVLYRRVNTGEEANLLLAETQPLTDSDDDLIL